LTLRQCQPLLRVANFGTFGGLGPLIGTPLPHSRLSPDLAAMAAALGSTTRLLAGSDRG
jgi:hypothetical protein